MANCCLVFVCLCIYRCFMSGQNDSEIKHLPWPSGQVYFLFSFLSVVCCSKFLFESVPLLGTSGIDGWPIAFSCKGNICHIRTQCNADGASNGNGPITVWRSSLETGWLIQHEDEWLTEVRVFRISISVTIFNLKKMTWIKPATDGKVFCILRRSNSVTFLNRNSKSVIETVN